MSSSQLTTEEHPPRLLDRLSTSPPFSKTRRLAIAFICAYRLPNTAPPTYNDRRSPRGENSLISALIPKLTAEQRVFVG